MPRMSEKLNNEISQRNAYLILSDLHLTDIEEHKDGWKAYKSSRYIFDSRFDALIEEFVEEAGSDTQLTLVLNGDIFDFDLITALPDDPPWPVSRFERRYGLLPTASKSAFKLERILGDHPDFVTTLAAFAAGGHQIVFTFGNHDRELHFEAVQALLTSSIAQAAVELGFDGNVEELIAYEPWFYYVPGQVYAEHGNQYDQFSSFRRVLDPMVERDGEEHVAVPMGNQSARCLINVMGFFNPHAEDFVLNVFQYLAHWFGKYLFKGRSLLFAWLWGSHVVLFSSLVTRRRVIARGSKRHADAREAMAERVALGTGAIAEIDALKKRPVTDSLFRLARELWIDRALIAMVMTGATVTLALTPIPLWIKLMVPLTAFPLLFLTYEAFAQESIFAYTEEIAERARRISQLTNCPVVTFGHTHHPTLIPLSKGATFVNSGTWAPSWDVENEHLLPGGWNYVRVDVTAAGSATVRLESFMGEPSKD